MCNLVHARRERNVHRVILSWTLKGFHPCRVELLGCIGGLDDAGCMEHARALAVTQQPESLRNKQKHADSPQIGGSGSRFQVLGSRFQVSGFGF